MPNVLIIDDEKSIRTTLAAFLKAKGYEVHQAGDADEGIRILEKTPVDVVLTDIVLPRIMGIEILKTIRQTAPDVVVVMMTGEPTVDTATESLRIGAFDYLTKPVTKDIVCRVVDRAFQFITVTNEKRRLEKENTAYREHLEQMVQEKTGELLKSKEQLKAIFESSADYLMLLDRDHRIVTLNRAEQGLTVQGCIGIPLYELVEASDRDRVKAHLDRVIVSGEREQYDTQYHHPDGTTVCFNSCAAPVIVEGEVTGCVVNSRDVTEQRSLQQQLRGAQRMEAFGKLAGGVAHDFNNILAVVNAFGGFAHDALTEEDPVREDLQQVLDASQRATRLTRQLLAFSRQQMAESIVLDLNCVIRDLERMLHHVIGEDVDLLTVPCDDLRLIKADRGHMDQILMNLAVNARDAMPHGGTLTIETSNGQLDSSYFADRQVDIPPGDYVILSVSDTGVGMEKGVRQHVFEPFFTTKEKGEGTGLGLSTVYGIVKQSNGGIWVHSELGKGTTFQVYLPQVDATEADVVPPPFAIESLSGSETVLLVEDDIPVCLAAQRILQKAGYTVLSAPNGDEALLVAEQHRGKIDLLLTDVIMPNMSGPALSIRLRGIIPDIPVVYMSGYTDNEIAKHGVLDAETFFIEKPFAEHALLEKLRMVLDKVYAKQ